MCDVRPKEMVCPSDPVPPNQTSSGIVPDESRTATTGSYAFSQGTRSISRDAAHKVECGNTGMFVYFIQRTMKQVIDGTSKTFIVGEVLGGESGLGTGNAWTIAYRQTDCLRTTEYALNTPLSQGFPKGSIVMTGGFASAHPGGGNFAYVDGHVTFVNDDVSLDAYRAASTFRGDADGIDLQPAVQ
jgi:prepilin-type processing-associated H-X9-DG protein